MLFLFRRILALNNGKILRQFRLNREHMSRDNIQYLEVWRPNTNTNQSKRGDFSDPSPALGGNVSFRDAYKVCGFNGRIVRSRRGKRTQESDTSDQIAIGTVEWVCFYPKSVHIERGDKILDQNAQTFSVLSYTPSETYRHMQEAVLREVF